MHQNERRKKQAKKPLGLIITIAVLSLVLVGVVGLAISGLLGQKDQCRVETPYGTLVYPSRWAENVKTETGMHDEGVYTVTYLCQVGDRTAKLFAVSFGDTESESLGYVSTESGREILVSIEYFTLEETIDWSENDRSLAHAMRDAGEELVSVLRNSEGFTPAQ